MSCFAVVSDPPCTKTGAMTFLSHSPSMIDMWIALAGIVGSGVVALVSNNRALWPSRIRVSRRWIVRPGLVATMVVGGVVALVMAHLLGAADGVRGAAVSGGVMAGALAAGWVTNDADKRLLRAAATLAAAAPAAHPKTVSKMDVEPPHAVFVIASGLAHRSCRY